MYNNNNNCNYCAIQEFLFLKILQHANKLVLYDFFYYILTSLNKMNFFL